LWSSCSRRHRVSGGSSRNDSTFISFQCSGKCTYTLRLAKQFRTSNLRTYMSKIEDRVPSPHTSLNDDIGEEKRLDMYRMQVEIREAEQRAFDLFLQNLVKGTSHLSLGQEAVAAGFAAAMRPGDL